MTQYSVSLLLSLPFIIPKTGGSVRVEDRAIEQDLSGKS